MSIHRHSQGGTALEIAYRDILCWGEPSQERWNDHPPPSGSCPSVLSGMFLSLCYRVFKKKNQLFFKTFHAGILGLYLLSWVGVWWIIKFSRNVFQNKNKNTAQPLWHNSWDLGKEKPPWLWNSPEAGKVSHTWPLDVGCCKRGDFEVR